MQNFKNLMENGYKNRDFYISHQQNLTLLMAPAPSRKRELGGRGTTDGGSAENIKVNQAFCFGGSLRGGKKA